MYPAPVFDMPSPEEARQRAKKVYPKVPCPECGGPMEQNRHRPQFKGYRCMECTLRPSKARRERIVAMHMAGATNHEIADEIGVTEGWVREVIRKANVKGRGHARA